MTRTYAARFSLPDAPAAARLGMSVTVTLDDGAAALARIPVGALFDAGQGPEVWTVDRAAGAIAATPVVVAAYDSEFAPRRLGAAPKARRSSRSASTSSTPSRRFASSKTLRGSDGQVQSLAIGRSGIPQLIAFLILMIGVAGALAYLQLGRAEDPSFTIKNVNVSAFWPGATSAGDAGPGRRPDREEAAGTALVRQDRDLHQARLHLDFLRLQGFDAGARSADAVPRSAQEDGRHARPICRPT